MRSSNKLFILLFTVITAPISAILGAAIDSVLNDTKLVNLEIKESLSWFAANPEISRTIVMGLYGFAGFLVLCGIIALFRIATDSKTSEDQEFYKDIRSN